MGSGRGGEGRGGEVRGSEGEKGRGVEGGRGGKQQFKSRTLDRL